MGRMMIPGFGAGVGIIVAALACAPVAHANQNDCLSELQPRCALLTSQQLLTEGVRVRAAIDGGRSSADTVAVVSKDLGVSVPVAFDIVSAAVVNLGC
jgi:hypothetical protein